MEFIESVHSIALPIHVGAVIVTLAIVVTSDIYGALWVLGKKQTLNHLFLRRLHVLIWVGLITIIFAGTFLFLPYHEYLLTLPVFQLKLLFVTLLTINAFIIGKHTRIATEKTFASLEAPEKITLIASGLVSVTGWIGAFTAAQFIGL